MLLAVRASKWEGGVWEVSFGLEFRRDRERTRADRLRIHYTDTPFRTLRYKAIGPSRSFVLFLRFPIVVRPSKPSSDPSSKDVVKSACVCLRACSHGCSYHPRHNSSCDSVGTKMLGPGFGSERVEEVRFFNCCRRSTEGESSLHQSNPAPHCALPLPLPLTLPLPLPPIIC